MDFTQLFNHNLSTASETVGAINCFGEYITSKFNDLANFMSGIGDYAAIYIPNGEQSVANVLARISTDVYDQACSFPENLIKLPVTDDYSSDEPSTYIEVSGETITEAVENQLSELRCQEQYIQYCLSNVAPSATDFMSRVRVLCPNMAGAVIDKFAQLIDISASPLECIKNFISQFKTSKIEYVDQRISLSNPNDYYGNIWQSAWTTVSTTVNSFFSNIEFNILQLGEFFTKVWDGVKKFGQWIATKAFGYLSTSYEEASSSPLGIIDLPLFQFYGSANDWDYPIGSIISGGVGYSWDSYNHKIIYSRLAQYLRESFYNLTSDSFDGVSYDSVCEVIIPTPYRDVSLRLGKVDNGDLAFTAHIVADYGTWSQHSDEDNSEEIFASLRSALSFASSVVPSVISPQDAEDTSIRWTEIANKFIDESRLSTSQIVDCLKHPSSNVHSGLDPYDTQIKMTIIGLLTYMCLMSKGFVDFSGNNVTDTVLHEVLYNSTNSLYTPTSAASSFITILDNSSIDLQVINGSTFRPYSKRNQLPVTIHYQTTEERGKEILSTILKIVIAVAAVVATIKIVKWRRNRSRMTTLAHANVDRLSWEVAGNPTSENMNAFKAAWSRARRMDFVNGILGLTTGSGTSVISSALGTLTNVIGKGTNASSHALLNTTSIRDDLDTFDADLSVIQHLIKR